MQAGRWLYNYPTYENYKNLLGVSKESKNGGLLWYYPNEYKLLRMVGREVTSCISQAEFLTAFNKLYDLGITNKEELLKVFLSFKSEEINFNNMLLELPLDNNYPEVILNGWLHAIIRLIDFYNNTGYGKSFIESTIKKLSNTLVQFDDKKNKISKYSNLSPYRIKIYNPSNPKIYYNGSNVFELKNDATSIYSCHITEVSGSNCILYIGIPNEYSPKIFNDEPFSIEFFVGSYSPYFTIPQQGGEVIKLNSVKSKDRYVIQIKNENLFTGYPTPFTKLNKKNYYHVYHVVALGEIIKSFDSEYNPTLEKYYLKWDKYIDDRNFEKKEIVEFNINKDRYIVK